MTDAAYRPCEINYSFNININNDNSVYSVLFYFIFLSEESTVLCWWAWIYDQYSN